VSVTIANRNQQPYKRCYEVAIANDNVKCSVAFSYYCNGPASIVRTHSSAKHSTTKISKMADEENGNNNNPPRRRPTRNRNNGTTLASSFKEFVGNASSCEIQEFSSQLTAALNSVSLKEEDTTSFATDADGNKVDDPNNNNNISSYDSNRKTQRRPSDDFYTPQPTSRRNSKAGDQLLAAMKQTAAELLSELGDISDDDDDDEIVEGKLVV